MTPHSEHDERSYYACPECRVEMDANEAMYRGQWRAERELRQSLALARADLDMGLDVDENELMDAIQKRIKS